MFSFFKKFRGGREPAPSENPAESAVPDVPEIPATLESPLGASTPLVGLNPHIESADAATDAPAEPLAAEPPSVQLPLAEPLPITGLTQLHPPEAATAPMAAPEAPSNFDTDATSAAQDSLDDYEIVPPPPPEPAARRSWMTRLKSGLAKTGSGLSNIFIGVKVDEALFEDLETALLVSDAGVDATEYLLRALRERVKSERLSEASQVKAALKELLVELLAPLEKSLVLGRTQPLVMMIAGVNGAGKTTSIGKLAKHLQNYGQSVLLAAGDTFRAAAREQLTIWGERNNVTVVASDGADPAAVIFDAVGAARARKIDVLMADTAGRLPSQLHLMEELKKVKRVVGKAAEGAPHEILLVIDANTGQNALAQVKAFDDALGLTGLIVTKLDGTAKGGILAAIARQRPVPVYFIGVGEQVDDLQPFSAREFASALLD